jgi:hypothetical protein
MGRIHFRDICSRCRDRAPALLKEMSANRIETRRFVGRTGPRGKLIQCETSGPQNHGPQNELSPGAMAILHRAGAFGLFR